MTGFRLLTPKEVVASDRAAEEEERAREAVPRCEPCWNGQIADAEGRPRRFLLSVEGGYIDIACPVSGCAGPDLSASYGDYHETLVTERPIPVTLTFDGPRPGHRHMDQYGCDCDWYLCHRTHPGDHLMHPFYSLLPPDDQADVREAVRTSIAIGRSFRTDIDGALEVIDRLSPRESRDVIACLASLVDTLLAGAGLTWDVLSARHERIFRE